jgi:hypothetical protein
VTGVNGNAGPSSRPARPQSKTSKNEVVKDQYNHDYVNNAPGDDYRIGDIFLF